MERPIVAAQCEARRFALAGLSGTRPHYARNSGAPTALLAERTRHRRNGLLAAADVASVTLDAITAGRIVAESFSIASMIELGARSLG